MKKLAILLVLGLVVLMVGCSAPLTSEPKYQSDVTYIEVSTMSDNWDADAEDDGIILNLMLFTEPEDYVVSDGKLIISLYNGIGIYGDQKGPLIEEWAHVLKKSDFSVGTCSDVKCGFINKIKNEYKKQHKFNLLSSGYIEVQFITQGGKIFQAKETNIPLFD